MLNNPFYNTEAELWKARYRSVTSLVEPKHVEAATLLVENAISLAAASNQSLSTVVAELLHVADKYKKCS